MYVQNVCPTQYLRMYVWQNMAYFWTRFLIFGREKCHRKKGLASKSLGLKIKNLREVVFPAVTVLTGRSIAFHTVITKFMYKICDDCMENGF